MVKKVPLSSIPWETSLTCGTKNKTLTIHDKNIVVPSVVVNLMNYQRLIACEFIGVFPSSINLLLTRDKLDVESPVAAIIPWNRLMTTG
jgi:hypothetical protein